MRSIELFSGAGGLALGLEAAGFESIALFERNRDACRTLRSNRPCWNVVEGDVRDENFRQYGKIDFVAGGPPCQPFSMGGKANGHSDRRDMFPEAVRSIRELSPRAFVFENVRGLLRPAFQNYVEYIRLQLSYPEFPISDNVTWEINHQRLQRHHTGSRGFRGLEYNVFLHLADAASYGVPQRHHRVFFVGFRRDLESGWSFPKPTHSKEQLIHSKDVSGEYWREHLGEKLKTVRQKVVQEIHPLLIAKQERWRTVRDAISDLGDPRLPSGVSGHRFQGGAKAYPGHTGSPLDEPAKALKAGDHGVPGGENMLRHPNGRVRYFSIREAARIQTFPDDWHFEGSWTESMRQLGNAVPVELARVVAVSIRAHLSTHGARRSLQSTR